MMKVLGLTGIIVLEPPLRQGKMFHYLHVKNQHLVEPLTAALQEMEKEGVIQQIQQHVLQDLLSPSN
jgi:polar amino acid transport system substrate-binding protein